MDKGALLTRLGDLSWNTSEFYDSQDYTEKPGMIVKLTPLNYIV